jgi:hypothetical protein
VITAISRAQVRRAIAGFMPFPEQALVEIVECSRPAAGFFIAVAAQVGPIPEAFLPVVKLLLLAGVLGAATTMVAMEYFLFSFDDSSARKKAFWFCGILFPLPGPALYCFIVYSHSDVLKGNHAKRVEGASEKRWSETQGLQQPESVKVVDRCGLCASIGKV